MEIVSGAALYRNLGLERLFRDVQGARYHYTKGAASIYGWIALGLDIDA
jgi:hypothetical protein